MRFVVETSDEPPGAGEWDALVAATGAPLFYRAQVLRAYHRHPLRDVVAAYYLTVRPAGSADAAAVVPVYLQRPEDPLRVLGTMLPGFDPEGGPILLSHVWHWYDTLVPARALDVGLLEAVCSELERLAVRTGAQGFGFMNVAAGGVLAEVLRASGREPVPIDARHVMDLSRFDGLEAYLASIPSGARQDLRRHARLAAAAGATVGVEPPEPDTLLQIAELCDITAAKHGNRGWYRIRRLADFVAELSGLVRLVTVRRGRELVTASVSFADGRRFHNWAAGSLPGSELPFSPYPVLLQATIDDAIGRGCEVLEGGRRNDAWKHRFGFTRVPLLGWVQPVKSPKPTRLEGIRG